jgi:hypothetical protein
MTCPYCPKLNELEARFCAGCGRGLPALSAPVVSAPALSAPVVWAPVVWAPVVSAPVVSAPVVSAPVVSAWVKWGVVAAGLVPFVGAIVCLIMGIKYWFNVDPAKKSVGKLWTGVAVAASFLWYVFV